MKAFLGLVVGLLIPAFFVGLTFRTKGLNQRFQALEHPLNARDFYFVAYQAGGGERPANTWEAIDHVRSLSWQILIWLDVHQTKDGELVLFGSDMLESQTEGQGHIGLSLWKDIQNLDAGYKFKDAGGTFPFRDRGVRIRTLEKTLERYPLESFVLNIRANAPKIDERITELLDKHHAAGRVILSSPFEIVTKSLKKRKPLGMYTVGLAEYTRLNMFASIFLGPAIPVKGDIFLTPRSLYQRSLDRDLISELHRRKKKVIVNVNTSQSWEKWRDEAVDGLMTSKPSVFLNAIHPTGVPLRDLKPQRRFE